jgi:hypothetical protein
MFGIDNALDAVLSSRNRLKTHSLPKISDCNSGGSTTQKDAQKAIWDLVRSIWEEPPRDGNGIAERLQVTVARHKLDSQPRFWGFFNAAAQARELSVRPPLTVRASQGAGKSNAIITHLLEAYASEPWWENDQSVSLTSSEIDSVWRGVYGAFRDADVPATLEALLDVVFDRLLEAVADALAKRSRAINTSSRSATTRDRVRSHVFSVGNPPPHGDPKSMNKKRWTRIINSVGNYGSIRGSPYARDRIWRN